jgi:hypothetical protein
LPHFSHLHGLDPAAHIDDIAAAEGPTDDRETTGQPMNATVQTPAGRRINWLNVMTVVSAAILIGAEVFGAAYAGGWALANLFALGEYGVRILQAIFFVLGIVVMARFILNARRVEPFTES